MHTLLPLPYGYNALEPFMDEATLRLHHDKHQSTYVDNLNKALENYPDFQTKTAEELISHLPDVPEDIRTQVRNQGGGVVNHNFFWQLMGPSAQVGELSPSLSRSISENFNSFEDFTGQFTQTAVKLFGSGWVWLVADKSKLSIISTPNQDSPLSQGLIPILTVDVWEHAYYLKYQNRRPEYIKAWWNLVDWEKVSSLFDNISK